MYCSLFNGTHSGNNSSGFHYIIALIDSPCPQCPMCNSNMFFFFFMSEMLRSHLSPDSDINAGKYAGLFLSLRSESRGWAEMKVKREPNRGRGRDTGQWEDQRKGWVDRAQRDTL